jgi:hypothetical protein
MEGIDEDARFAHMYTYTLMRERPGSPALTYFYPGARTDGGRDGVLIRFVPAGRRPWIGVFAWGRGGTTGVYTHPDAECVCVVAQGVGYIVRVDEPTQWMEIAAQPIVGVAAVLDHGLLVFGTYTHLLAYGADGPVWQTGRLALDELRITGVEGAQIYVRANRYADDDVDVTVDAKTGAADILHPW